MSIIHDALKKTQANLNNNEQKKAPEPKMTSESPTPEHNPPKEMLNIYEKLHKKPEPTVPPPTKTASAKNIKKNSNQKNPIVNFLTMMLCLFIIGGAFWFIYQYYAQDMAKKGVDLKKAFNIKPKKLSFDFGSKSTHPKSAPSSNKNLATGEITLNGITTMGEKRVALINNEIYQVGESIQGKKITDISMQKVDLEDSSGNITTLKVKGY